METCVAMADEGSVNLVAKHEAKISKTAHGVPRANNL